MSKIPTVKKFLRQSKSLHDMWDNTRGRGEWDEKAIENSHIEFAKLHVEAALKEASEKAVTDYEHAGETGEFNDISIYDYFVDKNSILNAYPLENVK